MTTLNFDWLMQHEQDAMYEIRDYYREQSALGTPDENEAAWWIHDRYAKQFEICAERALIREDYFTLARECLIDTKEIVDSESTSKKISKRSFYHERVVIDILSEERIDPDVGLTDIEYMIMDGSCSGKVTTEFTRQVDGRIMAMLLLGQGSDPSFFQLTDAGEDLDDEEGDDDEERS